MTRLNNRRKRDERKQRRPEKKNIGIVLIVLAIALFGTAINGMLLESMALAFIEIIIGLSCVAYGIITS